MIYGNESSDSKVNFEYYNARLDEYYTIQETVGFESDMIIGDGLNPYELFEDSSDMPSSYSLGKAYPNPFNPTTTIDYSIGQNGQVNMVVYDLSGRVVDTLVDGYKNEGNYQVTWAANAHSSGVYSVLLSINGYTESHKLMLIK